MTGLRPEGCGRLTAAGCVRWRSGGNGPSGRGLWYRPQGDAYKVSVTGFAFFVIWHDRHYDDEPPSVAPPFGALRHHLPPAERWDNKALKSSLLIIDSIVPPPTGQGGGASHQRRNHQRGNAFPRPQGGCMVLAAKGGIKNGAEGAVPRQRSDTI